MIDAPHLRSILATISSSLRAQPSDCSEGACRTPQPQIAKSLHTPFLKSTTFSTLFAAPPSQISSLRQEQSMADGVSDQHQQCPSSPSPSRTLGGARSTDHIKQAMIRLTTVTVKLFPTIDRICLSLTSSG